MENNHYGYKPIEPFQLKRKKACFILSNIVSTQADDLVGYNVDVENIITTFTGLGFDIKHEENKSADEMRDIFEEWSEENFSDTDCVVTFILSHGDEYGVIFGIHGNAININDIQAIWDRCDTLMGKPKLIFLQACRGQMRPIAVQAEEYSTAGPTFKKDSKFVDAFVYYSTSEGFYAYVSKLSGTTYIQKICDVLKKYGEVYSLSRLITLVNKMVSETVLILNTRTKIAQAPEAVYTLRSDFFFGNYHGEGCANVDGKDALLEQYHVKERNPCLILTNTSCKQHKSQCDNFKLGKRLIEKTFSDLNFEIELEENLKGADIESKFKKLKKKDYTKQDCLACVVLSCGGMSGDLAVIYGSDGKFTSIDNMISAMNSNKTLIGTPKLFFVVLNKCSKELFTRDEEEYSEAGGGGRAKCADTLVYYVVLNTEKACTFFITKLCEVLSEFTRSKKYHLGDVILKVNELCGKSEGIIPEVCHMLTREVYFKYTGAGCEAEGDGIEQEGMDIDKSTFVLPGLKTDGSDATDSSTSLPNLPAKFATEDEYEPDMKPAPSSLDQRPIGGNLSDGHVDDVTVTTSVIETKYPAEKDDLYKRQTASAEPTLEKMGYKQITRLKGYLDDPFSVVANWLQLGKSIFRGDREMSDKIDHLKRQLYGGGSPGEELVAYLQNDPNVTVKTFVDVAKKFRRNDILKLFKDIPPIPPIPPNTEFGDLEQSLRDKIAMYLDKDVKGIKKWRDFAYELDLTEDQVKEFQSAKKHSGSSPTEALFELVKAKHPQYTLSDLRANLQLIGRNDIAMYVDELIESYSTS